MDNTEKKNCFSFEAIKSDLQGAMDNIKEPFRGIVKDYQGRISCYKQDWIAGIRPGIGYLSYTIYALFLFMAP